MLNRRTHAAVVVPLLVLAVPACHLIRNQVFYQTSPDHKKKLVVGTYGLKPELRIDLEQGLRSRTLLTIMGEWYTGFLQMYWSPDSKICAFWIAANGSINGVLQAFDASTGKEVDPNLVRDNMRKLIVDKYKLGDQLRADPAFDPFEWSLTPEARFAFIDHAHEDER